MQCQSFDTISDCSTDSMARTPYVFDQMPTYYYTVWTVSVFVSGSKALIDKCGYFLTGAMPSHGFFTHIYTITGSKTLNG